VGKPRGKTGQSTVENAVFEKNQIKKDRVKFGIGKGGARERSPVGAWGKKGVGRNIRGSRCSGGQGKKGKKEKQIGRAAKTERKRVSKTAKIHEVSQRKTGDEKIRGGRRGGTIKKKKKQQGGNPTTPTSEVIYFHC